MEWRKVGERVMVRGSVGMRRREKARAGERRREKAREGESRREKAREGESRREKGGAGARSAHRVFGAQEGSYLVRAHGRTSIPEGRTEKRRPTLTRRRRGDSVSVRKHVCVVVGVRSVGWNCAGSGMCGE